MAVDVIVDGFVVVDGALDMSATVVDDSASAVLERFAVDQDDHLVDVSDKGGAHVHGAVDDNDHDHVGAHVQPDTGPNAIAVVIILAWPR